MLRRYQGRLYHGRLDQFAVDVPAAEVPRDVGNSSILRTRRDRVPLPEPAGTLRLILPHQPHY